MLLLMENDRRPRTVVALISVTFSIQLEIIKGLTDGPIETSIERLSTAGDACRWRGVLRREAVAVNRVRG